jgi:hypothetical protein
MDAFSVSGRDYFGRYGGYRRFLFGMSYARGITDTIELELGLPWLFCAGAGPGVCSASLRPDVALRGAVVRSPRANLVVGASVFDFTYSASAWARLKLVAPHRFSLELEPSVRVGIRPNTIGSWWAPSVPQDGNQTRATFVVDANLQLGDHVLVWADAVPYLPTSRLGSPGDAALQVIGGVTVAFTKSADLGASCLAYNVLEARLWEYVPDVYGCTLTLTLRDFGDAPMGHVSVPVTRNLY